MSKRVNMNSAMALAGIVGPIVLVVGDLAASLSTPNYSLIGDSISSLALTPLGWLQTVCFLAVGLLLEVFIAGLLLNIRRARGFRLGIGLLILCGFGLLMIAAFRMDPSGAPQTTEGAIHSATAYALSFLLPIAIVLLAPSVKSDPKWRNLFVYTLLAGALGLTLTIGLLLLPNLAGWFGLYERIIVGNVMIWVAAAAVHLLRLSLTREPQPRHT